MVTVLDRLKNGDSRAQASKEERATRCILIERKNIRHLMFRYQGLPRNIHRHVIISEHKEALSHLPPELKEANFHVISTAMSYHTPPVKKDTLYLNAEMLSAIV